MSKLYKDINKMKHQLYIIQQYNNFKQLGINEEILYLSYKINNLLNIKENDLLIKEFNFCSKYINQLYLEVDSEFKREYKKSDI